MTYITLYNKLGQIIAKLAFPKGRAPSFSKLYERFPDADRIELV